MARAKASAYTVAQAAQLLGRTPKRIRQLIADGTFTVIPGSVPQQIPADQVQERRRSQRAGASTPGPRPQPQGMTVQQFREALADALAQQKELISSERAALEVAHARTEQVLRAELERERAERMTAQAQAAELRQELDQLRGRTEAPKPRWWQRST